MKYRIILILMFLMVGILDCHAKREPSWMKEMPLPANNTYIYVRESGEGKTAAEALNMALVRVFQNTANRLGKTFNEKEVFETLQRGTNYVIVSQQYGIPINKVDQYEVILKNGSYWVCVLCQVASMRDVVPVWDKGERARNVTDGASLAKSIIPGLGQMGKGYMKEGVATMLGEVALVGGGIGCYVAAQKQLDIMNRAGMGTESFMSAHSRYNSLKSTSYVIWGVAGALYVFNFIRAYTLEPKPELAFAWSPSLISAPNAVVPTVGLTFRF
ncbi:MAG: hypothetical protein IJK84_02400 [Bacteroidales bacterium]|nr:hypothetical protein [Bacteroidales bacterium]